MKTYQVMLPDEFAAFVDQMLHEQKWDTVEDLVMTGLARVQDDLRAAAADHEALRNEIRIGIEQADRGELADGPAVMDRLREKLLAARKQPS